MPVPDGELPAWIESRIERGSYDMELTQRHVALEFVHGDRPYYSVAQMHAVLGGEVSDDTVRSRLDELCERGVLASEQINNGGVYWLDRDGSQWPLPPDVTPEASGNEMTIDEWQRQPHVRIAAVAVFAAIVGTAITLLGVFQGGGYYQSPIATSRLISLGLTTGIVSYLGLLGAGLIWMVGLPEWDVLRRAFRRT